MDGERKSVFDRLGPMHRQSVGAKQSALVPNAGSNSNIGTRHRAVHIKRRSHQMHSSSSRIPPPPPPPPQKKYPEPLFTELPPGTKKLYSELPIKIIQSTLAVVNEKPKLRRWVRRKKPRAPEDTLDEGEIIDEEDEYEDVEEELEDFEIKKENNDQRNEIKVESDYSDWSDGDDDLLAANNSQEEVPLIKEEALTDEDDNQEHKKKKQKKEAAKNDEIKIKEEEDSQDEGEMHVEDHVIVDQSKDQNQEEEENNESVADDKNIEDLVEAISDDDLDPLSDDFFQDSSKSMDVDEDLLLGKSQDSSDATKETTTSKASTEVADIKLMDILEIDWKSLITEPTINNNNQAEEEIQDATTDATDQPSSKSKASHAEYLQRNSTIALLNRIGFSHQLAGPKLTAYIETKLAEKLGDQYQPMLDPQPAVHCYYRGKRELRERFFSHDGPTSPGSPLNGAKIEALGKMLI